MGTSATVSSLEIKKCNDLVVKSGLDPPVVLNLALMLGCMKPLSLEHKNPETVGTRCESTNLHSRQPSTFWMAVLQRNLSQECKASRPAGRLHL